MRFMFCCGVEWKVFNEKYEAQPEEEQQRLRKVAWRIWVTLKLRYGITTRTHIPSMGWDAEFKFTHIEWPSMEVYLLVSCLDTLAGKPVYQGFDDWLKAQERFSNLDTDGVLELFQRYRKDHGPRQTLRQEFMNLPKDIKKWLSQNVVIQRSNQVFNPARIKQDPEILVKRLFVYFYDVRRNEFTHGSSTRQTTRAENIDPSDRSWTLSLAGWEYATDKKRYWNLYHRSGLDEATILRVVIQAVVLQRLGIEPKAEIIDKYITAQARLSALYGFLGEVDENARSLAWWPKFDETARNQFNILIGRGGIPSLDCKWPPILLERFIDCPFEKQPRHMTAQYQESVGWLNAAIANFNSSHPPLTTDPSTDEWNDLMRAIKEFLKNQVKTPDYSFVLQTPYRKEIDAIWLIIRDPCYS